MQKYFFHIVLFVCLSLVVSCDFLNKNDTLAEPQKEELKNDTLFLAEKNALIELFSLPDSTKFSLTKVSELENFLAKKILPEDSLIELKNKLKNWGAAAYLATAKIQMESLKDLGWDFNDYLNKLIYLEDLLFQGSMKYPNTLAGIELKEELTALNTFKNKCLDSQEKIAPFLEILSTNTIKTKEEIATLSDFAKSIELRIFKEKIAFHKNSFALNLVLQKLLKFEPTSIKEVNTYFQELKDAESKVPINDSLLVEATTVNKKSKFIRQKALEKEIAATVPSIIVEVNNLAKKNCGFSNHCGYSLLNTMPVINANFLQSGGEITVVAAIKSGDDCSILENKECVFLLNVKKSLQNGFSYSLTKKIN